jgi:translocation and assembly module TamB
VGGAIEYTVGPKVIEIQPSRLATPFTSVEFQGQTAYGDDSYIPFQVSSADWQESDRLMAAFLTAFGAGTEELAIGGHGRLDGVMSGTFASPRIDASFDGQDVNAWNVDWGSGRGEIAVEGGYLDVSKGLFSKDGATLSVVDGRFALGAPPDGGDEITGTFELTAFPAERIREAFRLDGYNIDGPLTGEIRLTGDYRRPFGAGHLTLTDPVAYGEPFDSADTRLRFEGDGVRVEGLDVRKGSGAITGAAFIRWDGTYSFNADGRGLAVASIDSARVERFPLGGGLQFSAEGAGAFEDPRYEVRGTVSDLTVSGETVGEVSGRIDIRDGVMGFEAEAASARLAVSGSGRVVLMDTDAELLFRFTNTTIDPYVRAFRPELSDKLSAEVSGTLQILGSLRDVEALQVVSTVEQLDLDVYDYQVQNDGPVKFTLDDNVVEVERMQLVGEGTALEVGGQIGLGDERVALRATGDAGLGLLEGFFPDVRGSGNARLVAEVGGTFRQPLITGEVFVDDARIRHLAFPHGLERIDGQIVFEPDGIRFDDLTGELGNGTVRFGGRVGLDGLSIGELNVTATGTEMRLRFPEGVRSLVDAELALVGGAEDVVLTGTVDVRDAVLLELFESSSGLLDFGQEETLLLPETEASELPLRFDVRINAPSSLRISDSAARVVSSAELTLGGTYDQPLLYGNAEIERGEVFFEGNRYRVTRGSIGFANPTTIEPFFDIEAETDVRAPGQTYRVTLGVVGTVERLDFELASDPPLPEFEIMSLLLGNIRDPQAAELRTLRAQGESRQELFQAGAARLLTSPLSSGVGRVVEESFGVDTFQITPSLVDPSAQQSAQLLPTARLLIGKRISERAHVTLSRTLTGANQDIIVVVEYDQNDRLSWILSQNEDRTYALDFRMRHAF